LIESFFPADDFTTQVLRQQDILESRPSIAT